MRDLFLLLLLHSSSSLSSFLAIRTSFPILTSVAKGRILIFDILKPQAITSSKLDLLYEKEQRGPVSAITQCNGNVAIAIGPKVLTLESVFFF
jgi:cleavage and polyadenylation specificity factor subunit 1